MHKGGAAVPTPVPPPPPPSRLVVNALTLKLGPQQVGVFVVSGGNLAASYVANVVNQVIFSLLQEACTQRAKEVRGGAAGQPGQAAWRSPRAGQEQLSVLKLSMKERVRGRHGSRRSEGRVCAAGQ